MTEILIGTGLVIFLGGLFYFFARKHNRQLENVDEVVYREAKTRGLEIKSMVNPSFQQWPESPFEREIKIGTLGFEGNSIRQRILQSPKMSGDEIKFRRDNLGKGEKKL